MPGFLAALFRGDHEAALACLGEPGWSWEALIAVASAEALLPALYAQLNGLDLMPAELAGFFERVEAANRERNEVILAQLRSVVSLLNGAGIEPVLLKGNAYLATGVYPDTAGRYLADIDLLVSPGQMPVAAGLLRECGYTEGKRDPFGPYRHHYPALWKPGSAPIEVHDRLGLARCGRVLPAREVLARALPLPPGSALDGLRARVPCAEHMMVHLILHSQMQHAYNERIWPPLRALWDVVTLARRFGSDLDWAEVSGRFEAAGYGGLLTLHLMQVDTTLGFRGPTPLRMGPVTRLRWIRRQALRRRPGLRHIDPLCVFSIVLGRRLALLGEVARKRGGLRYLMREVFDPRHYGAMWRDFVAGKGQ